jgi:glycosyltransferase involved in cell wall biosynthesis
MKIQNKSLKISIITVCYNILEAGRKDFFKQMLDSIHNQTYANIEHIIVDGASNDGSVEYINAMLEPYKHRSIVFVSEPDTGIYDAMNKGWRLATGDYVTYLNSDDFYHDFGGIERVAKKIRQKASDCLCSPVKIIRQESDTVYARPRLGRFLVDIPFCHQGVFIKKSVFVEHNGFDHVLFQLGGDYDFILRMLLNKAVRVAKLKHCFVTFREGGMCSNLKLVYQEYANVFQKNYTQYLPDYNQDDWTRLSKTRKLPFRLLIQLRHCLSIWHYYWLFKWYCLGR